MEEVIAPPSSNIIQKVKCFDMLYFSIFVEHHSDCSICQTLTPNDSISSTKPNAFHMLMSSARAQHAMTPKRIENPSNAKEEQFNKVFEYLQEIGCVFSQGTVTVGTRFIQKICNALWYVDGHTATIERESSRRFPESLKKLLGFNKPEKSKHRKRAIENLSGNKLSELSMDLKESVQAIQFAKSEEWCSLKLEILKVAHVMDDYARYF